MNINLEKIVVNTHASICIDSKIYVDPFKITHNKHNADIVFVTHSHYDHLDLEAILRVVNDKTIVVCPGDVASKLTTNGFNSNRIAIVCAGDKGSLRGVDFEVIPAYNINKDFHPVDMGWVGYILTIDGVRYCVCGDSDVTPELKSVKCDCLFVPIGGSYTMDIDEAVELLKAVKPKIAIPVHYGSIVGDITLGKEFKDKAKSICEIVLKI